MSTSVHFPPSLVERLDLEAALRGVSRNRLIIDACTAFLEATTEDWPEELFQPLPDGERKVLESSTRQLEAAVAAARSSKKEPPF